MTQKFLSISFIAVFVGLASVHAQQPTPPKEPGQEEGDPKTGEKKNDDQASSPRFWQTKLDGGEYMIALDRISSISRHKYVLDGALIVDEVTIDSIGQALARFYFITPITDAATTNAAANLTKRVSEVVEQVGDRVAPGVQDMVVKKYPDTTHARTIEYRLLSENDLKALFTSAKNAWESGRGRKFTITAP